jgi:hypothetical protein
MTPETFAALFASPEFRTAVLSIVQDSLTVEVDTGTDTYSGREYVTVSVCLDGKALSSESFSLSS